MKKNQKKKVFGLAALEYAIIAAGIAIVIIAAVNTLGGNIKDKFESITTALTAG